MAGGAAAVEPLPWSHSLFNFRDSSSQHHNPRRIPHSPTIFRQRSSLSRNAVISGKVQCELALDA